MQPVALPQQQLSRQARCINPLPPTCRLVQVPALSDAQGAAAGDSSTAEAAAAAAAAQRQAAALAAELEQQQQQHNHTLRALRQQYEALQGRLEQQGKQLQVRGALCASTAAVVCERDR